MEKVTVDMSAPPLKNMMLISVFNHIILFIRDLIFLGRFKLGDKVLDLSGLGAIFFGQGADAYFILDDGHEF